jgi:hypothetical protein
MRTPVQSALPILLSAALCSAACGQYVVTGPVAAGTTITRFNEDVLVRDCWVVPGLPGATTITIRVYNGAITVGDGLGGSFGLVAGRHSESGPPEYDGQDGQPCSQPGYPPTDATAATAGFSVVLETWPNGGSRDLSISVLDPILAGGGYGGDGRDGCDEQTYPNDHCAIYGAHNASKPTPGAAGGNITLRGSGDIHVSAALDTRGGQGGNGATGGAGAYGGPGNGTAGGAGGGGGTVVIEHTSSAKSSSTCNINYYYGSIDTSGGLGGQGGNGNYGNGTTHGAAGGNGGRGGPVTLNVRYLSVSAGISAQGGNGGNGGSGTPGRDSGWYWVGDCYLKCNEPKGEDCCWRIWSVPYPGGNAGPAGPGGNGGAVNIAVAYNYAHSGSVSTRGGDGGHAGQAGYPGAGDSTCIHFCTQCPTVQTAGSIQPGGAGGAGGAITVNVAQALTGNGSFITSGGTGGNGSQGVDSRPVCRGTTETCEGDPCPPDNEGNATCCGPDIVCSASAPRPGGAGGKGGSGATISITCPSISTFLFYAFCGGSGGYGGDGGYGVLHIICDNLIQWQTGGAAGGQAGADGGGGKLIRTGYPTVYCAIQIPDPTDPRHGDPGGYGSGCIGK